MTDGVCPFASLLQGADWSGNGARVLSVRAVTVHMTEGTNSVGLGQSRHHDTPGTFNFLTGRAGELWQFYPADVRCSHAAGANQAGPGIENEGFTGQALPDAQVQILGRLCHWLSDQYGLPLTYRTGDPRVYVDATWSFSGFIAHRAVDYPPDHSLLHFDEITTDEWARATGTPTKRKRHTMNDLIVHGPGGHDYFYTPAAKIVLPIDTAAIETGLKFEYAAKGAPLGEITLNDAQWAQFIKLVEVVS